MNRGFTLVELFVVMGVVVLMTVLVLPNWRSGERSLALDRTVHKAGQDVRKTQELSLRAEPHTCLPEETESMFAYGIFFDSSDPDSYLIFAECDKDSIGYDPAVDDIIEEIMLENDIVIKSVSPSPTASIVFVPPTPKVWIKPEPGDPAQGAKIIFERIDKVKQRQLNISSKGIVDVD